MFASSEKKEKEKFLANLGQLENRLNEKLTLSGLLSRCADSSSHLFWLSTVGSINHVHLFKMILGDEINEPVTTKNEDLSQTFYKNALSILEKLVAEKKLVFEDSKYVRAYFFCLLEVYKRILENKKEPRSIFQKKQDELIILELLQGYMCGKYSPDKFTNFNPFYLSVSPILRNIYLKTKLEDMFYLKNERKCSASFTMRSVRSSEF